jgi:hypothetical protein
MAGGVQYSTTFGASRQVRKLHLEPSGLTGELPSQSTLYSLKRNFFHRLFSDFLLSGSDVKGRECKEGGS